MTVGITFGCFIPLHKGHLSMISTSRANNDLTIIAVCGHDNDRGKGYIPFEDRYRLMKQIYQDDPRTLVVKIDDNALGLDGTFTLKNWELWCAELFEQAGFDPTTLNDTFTWYSGEPDYVQKLKVLYPTHEFCLLDRGQIGISGTMIRKNTEEYLNVIHPAFRTYLARNKVIRKKG